MTTVNVKMTNMDKYLHLLAVAPRETTQAIEKAVHAEALTAFANSQKQVPFDKGILASSGTVTPPANVGGTISVEIMYGGAARNYARVQHENDSFRHDAGRKAHYLRDPVKEQAKEFETNLKARIDATMRGLI